MTLLFRHRFAAPLAATLASLESADYPALLAARHPFFAEVTVLSLQHAGSRVTRTLRYRAQPFITRLGPFAPASDWFVWTEHSQLDRASGRLTFDNVPVLAKVRHTFRCCGSMQFREQRDAEGRVTTVRDARFELGFSVSPLYRPLAELALGLVRRQLAHTLDVEAALLSEWLATPTIAARDLRLTA